MISDMHLFEITLVVVLVVGSESHGLCLAELREPMALIAGLVCPSKKVEAALLHT